MENVIAVAAYKPVAGSHSDRERRSRTCSCRRRHQQFAGYAAAIDGFTVGR